MYLPLNYKLVSVFDNKKLNELVRKEGNSMVGVFIVGVAFGNLFIL